MGLNKNPYNKMPEAAKKKARIERGLNTRPRDLRTLALPLSYQSFVGYLRYDSKL